jgi:uncharacterized protein
MPDKSYCFHNESSNMVVASRVKQATTYLKRLLGLLFSAPLKPNDGLWFTPCNSIHTIGMKFAIDVVFLDRNGTVLRVYSSLPPGKIVPIIWRAHHCVELSPGTLAKSNTKDGDKISWKLNV